MYSGIKVHWSEEEKESRSLFCRIEKQIANPVGVSQGVSALFIKEKSTVILSMGILGPQCKIQFRLIMKKRGQDVYFVNGNKKLLLVISHQKHFWVDAGHLCGWFFLLLSSSYPKHSTALAFLHLISLSHED